MREKFVVEWSEDSGSPNVNISPTQVMPTLGSDREVAVRDDIQQATFDIPLYFCNSSTPTNILGTIKEERRVIIPSQTKLHYHPFK